MSNKKIIIVSVLICMMILGGVGLIITEVFKGSDKQSVVVKPDMTVEEFEESQTEEQTLLSNETTDVEPLIENTVTEETEEENYINYTENITEGNLSGIDVYYEIPDNGKTKYENFRDLAIEYNKSIPFLADGAWYELGHEKYKKYGYDMYKLCSLGMNAQTYIQWMYLNVFGYVPKELRGNLAARYLESDNQIELSEVRIGDIGLYSDSIQGENHYAVCVGYDADLGIPIFSHMSNNKCGGFVEGTNRMSYVASTDRIFIGDSAPVELHYYYRISGLEWE